MKEVLGSSVAGLPARPAAGLQGSTPLEGSDLYFRMVVNSEHSNDLMRKVWAGTPWMVNAYTGEDRDRRRDEMYRWCVGRCGVEAFPFGPQPRPGRWREGNARVMGWTWWGFSTEAEMREFTEAWPPPSNEEQRSSPSEASASALSTDELNTPPQKNITHDH